MNRQSRTRAPISRSIAAVVSAPGLVPSGDVKRAGGFKGIRQLILRYGGNPAELLAEFDVPAAKIDDPESYLSYPAMIELLEFCADRFDAPFFGFELGKGQSSEVLGPLAAILLAAPTMGDALSLLSRFMSVHAPGARYGFEVSGDEARVSYRIMHAGSTFSRQINEMNMTTAFNVLKAVAGPDFSPNRIEVASDPPPRRTDLLEAYFGAPVHYQRPLSLIAMPARYLSQSIDSSNPALLRLAETHLEALTRHSTDLRDQVEQEIRRLLPVGECSLPNIAHQMGMHQRSLQNRLHDAGIEFRELVRAEREKLAYAYLGGTNTPLAEIGILLGYSDQAAFTRAFATWTGTSPRKYRLSNASGRQCARPGVTNR